MNGTNNWFDNDTINIHQNDLYREANNERLAHEAAQPSRIVSVYVKAIASLGSRMILWGTNLQKRNERRVLSTAEMKAV
jgi:hypothetical protein